MKRNDVLQNLVTVDSMKWLLAIIFGLGMAYVSVMQVPALQRDYAEHKIWSAKKGAELEEKVKSHDLLLAQIHDSLNIINRKLDRLVERRGER